MDEASGRTKTIQTKSCMAILFSAMRGMSWCNENFSVSETAESRHFGALFLVKVLPVNKNGGDQATRENSWILNSCGRAEVPYPP